MTRKDQTNVRSLAIAYAAFLEASKAEDNAGMITWGESLLQAQEATGVFLQPADLVTRRVAHARVAFKAARYAA